MADRRKSRVNSAVWAILFIVLISACANGPVKQVIKESVTTEYLLDQAGFQKMSVHQDYDRKWAALMNNTPKGQITTFRSNGSVYHVYNEPYHDVLYIGDELAYQRYLSLTQGQNLCRRVEGPDGSQFWACFQEYEQRKTQGLK
jgi:hypothetical protein